jgi:rhamnosyltransferase
MKTGDKIFAVVVTYRPDAQALCALLSALAPQVAGVILIDNTPGDDARVESVCADFETACVRVIRLGNNYGIAYALNIGIATAIEVGATHVLLSDQDSLPADGMVSALMRTQAELVASGKRVAAVGPAYTDRYTGITFPFQVKVPGKLFYGHRAPNAKHPVIEVLTLITSGTLIPVKVIGTIGSMREDFFIDYVDVDWCHRARAAGYSLYGTGAAVMYHALGDHALRVWYFGWRNESAYSPLRSYYRIRNYIALCRMPIIDRWWKLRSGWYCIGFIYSQTVFGRQRLASLKMALRGLWDGLFRRMGPFRD